MPNINRPSLKHKTNFKTKDGDRWLAFEDDALINQMIEAFMIINSKVIWNKTILKSCNRAFCNLPGGQDFAAVWRDAGVFVSFNPNPALPSLGSLSKKTSRSRRGSSRIQIMHGSSRERLCTSWRMSTARRVAW